MGQIYSSSPFTSQVLVNSPNGHGSSSTKIRLYTTTYINNGGNDLSVVHSATLGTSITVNTAGLYRVEAVDTNTSTAMGFGLSKNTTAPTTDVGSLSDAERIVWIYVATANFHQVIGRDVWCNAGDVIRCHNGNGSGLLPNASSSNMYMCVTRLA